MGPRNPRIAKTKYHEPVRTVTERTVRRLRFAAIVLAVTEGVSRRAVSEVVHDSPSSLRRLSVRGHCTGRAVA
jgi:hypothetical protein